jgi:hypothetical protein
MMKYALVAQWCFDSNSLRKKAVLAGLKTGIRPADHEYRMTTDMFRLTAAEGRLG